MKSILFQSMLLNSGVSTKNCPRRRSPAEFIKWPNLRRFLSCSLFSGGNVMTSFEEDVLSEWSDTLEETSTETDKCCYALEPIISRGGNSKKYEVSNPQSTKQFICISLIKKQFLLKLRLNECYLIKIKSV